jgi:hypothetical protein
MGQHHNVKRLSRITSQAERMHLQEGIQLVDTWMTGLEAVVAPQLRMLILGLRFIDESHFLHPAGYAGLGTLNCYGTPSRNSLGSPSSCRMRPS